MLRLFDAVFDEKYGLKEKITYLECSSYLGCFIGEGPRSVESVTKKIKSLISVQSTRTEGLVLLLSFFPQCSTEVFSENATCWLQFTSKTIQESDKAEDKRLACSALIKLIPYIVSFPELSKYASTLIIPLLVETLLKTSPEHEWIDDALELLELCIIHYPGPCGQFKTSIEKFCISYIHQWYGTRLQRVTSCIALLPFCGGGGSQGINHVTAWTEQINNILSSLTHLLEMLYVGTEIGEDTNLFLSALELPTLPVSDPLLCIFQASKIYEFVNLCLAQMLSKQTTFLVKIPIEAIITHICKAFATNSNTMVVKPSVDAGAIASLIPGMHFSCLKVMEALIYCCRKMLLPQANVINDLLLQTLNWTVADETISGYERPYSALRRTTYNVIQLWLKVAGSGTGLQNLADQLFHNMALDFKPEVEVHNLQQKSSYDKKKYNPKRNKFKEFGLDRMMNDTNIRKMDSSANKETVKASLDTLKAMLYYCGPQIQADVWKKIHGTVISLILQIQHQPHKYPIPYSSPICREALYKVLLAAVLSSNTTCPPPLAPAIRLFSIGQNDENLDINYTCFESLVVCNAIVHPKVSVLQYSAPISRANSHLNLGYTEESNATEEAESDFSEDQDSPMEDEDSQMQQIQVAKSGKHASMHIEEERQFSQHKGGPKKQGKQVNLNKSSEEVILTTEESDSEASKDAPAVNVHVKSIDRNNQKSIKNAPIPPKSEPVMAYKHTPGNIMISSVQGGSRQNCNAENRMQTPVSRLESKDERQLQKPKTMQNKIPQVIHMECNEESEEEDDYEDVDEEEIYEQRETEEEFEEGEMDEEYPEEQEIEDLEEYQEPEEYPVSIIADSIQCVPITLEEFNTTGNETEYLEPENDVYTNSIKEKSDDAKKPKEFIMEQVDEATIKLKAVSPSITNISSVKESTEIVSSHSLAPPVTSNIEIQAVWHPDENGITNDERDKMYSDQSSDQAMKIISELKQVAEISESPPVSQALVKNKLNDLESELSPDSDILNKETGVTLQKTLDQVDKINDAHPLEKMDQNIEEKFSKDKRSNILDSFYQPPSKKICAVVEEEELSIPSLKTMQESFVDCGQNE